MKLHHCAFRITLGASEQVQRIFEQLGAVLVWEGKDQGREIALRLGENIIQFSEVDEAPQNSKNKIESHIAFASDDPAKEIAKLRASLETTHILVRTGAWSDTEHWLDCPSLFVDFVIAILDPRRE